MRQGEPPDPKINENRMLTEADGVAVKGSVKTGKEALDLLTTQRFDIILMDLNLPDINGLLLIEKIKQAGSQAKLLALTSLNDIGSITQLLQKGAHGYLLKNIDRNELLEAIDQVLNGKIYLSKDANDKVLEQYRNLNTAMQQVPVLTRRETEILLLLNDGLSGPEIAKKLFVSPHTVESHRKNLMQKFNAGTSQLLLKLARQYKLID